MTKLLLDTGPRARPLRALQLGFLLLALCATAGAQQQRGQIGVLAGAYELIKAPNFDPQGAWPQGIENRRYIFAENGDWFSLLPEAKLSQADPIGWVELKNERLVFHTPEGQAPSWKYHLSPEELRIIHGEHSVWLYRRLKDPAKIEGPIEPRSLEVLEVDQSTASAQSFPEILAQSRLRSRVTDTALHGVWELERVANVPEAQRPDQGYYNDVLLATAEHFCFIQRAQQNATVCIKVHVRDSTLLLDAETADENKVRYSFNAFGHLKLVDETSTQWFRKVADDPAKAPPVPLKIAVYRDER